MEYEMVKAKVPRGFVREGTELVVGVPQRGDLVRGNVHCPYLGECSVFLRPILLKPDWNPPKLKKGWVTWDESGWQWWPLVPRAKSSDGWVNPETGGVDDSYYLDQEMTELLGMPDCAGYEWSDCIWEVGE